MGGNLEKVALAEWRRLEKKGSPGWPHRGGQVPARPPIGPEVWRGERLGKLVPYSSAGRWAASQSFLACAVHLYCLSCPFGPFVANFPAPYSPPVVVYTP